MARGSQARGQEGLEALLPRQGQLVDRVAARPGQALVGQRHQRQHAQPQPGGKVIAVHKGAVHRASIVHVPEKQESVPAAEVHAQAVDRADQADAGQDLEQAPGPLRVAAELEGQEKGQAVAEQAQHGVKAVVTGQGDAARQVGIQRL